MGRWEDEKRANCLYRVKFRRLTRCIYCGGPKQDMDHVFPLWAAVGLPLTESVRRELGPHGLCRVPSCRNCNSLAGSKTFTSILEKRAYIQKQIKTKYLKRDTTWSKAELDEMGYTLRCFVIKFQSEADEHWCRAFWPRSRKLYKPTWY